MAYASFSVVFGEQPSAAKWNILGTNDSSFNDGTGIGSGVITPEKLVTGSGTTWPWISYTPTLNNMTLGNGTLVAKYRQIGKNIDLRISIVWGSTTSLSGSFSFSLPVTAVAYAGSAGLTALGTGYIYDQSASRPYYLAIGMLSTTTAEVRCLAADQPYLYSFAVNATNPMTFTTSDEIAGQLGYEAA